MPTVTPTVDEQAQIDQLLKEFDPERHPKTAALMQILRDDYRDEIVGYMKKEMLRRVEFALAIKACLENLPPADLDDEITSRMVHELRSSLADAFIGALDSDLRSADMSPLFAEIHQLFRTGNWDGVVANLDDCISGPAHGLIKIDLIELGKAEATV